ncbi:MAG: hypothetical protein QI223_03320, partial [Candidatus Korarchaeota archaeon]|nr:hypothetical protein [Candidatus Korarchaeota archaeon]
MGRRAVAFDLDGTLLTLPVPWTELKLRVSKALSRPVYSFRDLFRELWGTEYYWMVSSMVEEAEVEAVSGSAMFSEVKTVLEGLATRFDIYLITLQSRRAADAALRFHGIRRLFRGLITREDGPDRPSQARVLVRRVGRAVSLVDDHLDQLVEVQATGLGLREITA